MRDFPIDQFNGKQWKILKMYFDHKKPYSYIAKRLKTSRQYIGKTIKLALFYCPTLAPWHKRIRPLSQIMGIVGSMSSPDQTKSKLI